ncbi:MAG: hypothetical protein AMJ75_01010 [Phycisphaerae bacterium SM1_79]|nr:MAG: hypothetical protein AMJ75_01010 [Phycisphaerae bacterium SM1_79]
MGKKVAVIVLVVLIVAGTSVYLFFPREATYTFYGTEIIATNAPSNKLGNILPRTAWELGDSIAQEGGGKHLPSFHQGARSWKDEAGNIIAARGITELDDRDGNHCTMEDIVIPGKPRIILSKSDTEASTMALANELMRQFRLFKIKRKE